MSLHVLLPPKEYFTESNAGAVAQVVRDSLVGSKFEKDAVVFGKPLSDKPLAGLRYKGIRGWQRFIYGNNLGFARAYCAWLKRQKRENYPHLIEVHNRPQIASVIARTLPEVPVASYQHNDPRSMKSAKTSHERARLAKELAGVMSNSSYIEECFKDGLSANQISSCHFATIHLGIPIAKTLSKKTKTILMVGRITKEKGILEAALATAKILPQHPDWQLIIIGASWFENKKERSPYEHAVAEAIAPLGEQAKMLGFLPLHQVRQYQAEAAISLAPSQWQEPAGRVIIEALASGSALITSERGGIPEYAQGRAIILPNPDIPHIAEALNQLLTNSKELSNWQKKALNNFPFTSQAFIKKIDAERKKLAN